MYLLIGNITLQNSSITNPDEQISWTEQRKHPRRSYIKPVTIHAGDFTIGGMIQDISLGGVYIEVRESVPVGQKIIISYLISNKTDEIEVQGEVVWADQNGFGMKYI
jgi:hypothetical protein